MGFLARIFGSDDHAGRQTWKDAPARPRRERVPTVEAVEKPGEEVVEPLRNYDAEAAEVYTRLMSMPRPPMGAITSTATLATIVDSTCWVPRLYNSENP